MTLSLSAAAAPGVAFAALDVACQARGLDGIELVIETGDDTQALAAQVRASGARIVALRAERFDDFAAADLARLSGELAVPLSTPLSAASGGSLPNLAQLFAKAGGTLLFGFGSDLDQVVALTNALRSAGDPPSLGLAWELRPSVEGLATSGAILLTVREHLRLVRLHGGGPEQHDQDGRGVGAVFVDLAISGIRRPNRPLAKHGGAAATLARVARVTEERGLRLGPSVGGL